MSASPHADRPLPPAGRPTGACAPPPAGDRDAVLRAAHRLATCLAACLEGGSGSGEIEPRFAAAGLGALTVPVEHGGRGQSYETVAHVVRIVAAADRSAGEAIRRHLGLVATIGSLGDATQQAALFPLALRGLRFGRVLAGGAGLRLREHGGRHVVVEGRMPAGARAAGGLLPPHLLPLLVQDERQRRVHAIVDADAVRHQDGAALLLSRDRLLRLPRRAGSDPARPDQAIRLLLRAAVDAGRAGRAVADRIGRLRDAPAAAAAAAIEGVGDLRLQLDAAIALLEKAGRAVDRAVIRPTAPGVALAQVAAAGARILTGTLLQQAAAPPPDQAGPARPHRTRRTDPMRSRYALLGAFYLNGAAPAFFA